MSGRTVEQARDSEERHWLLEQERSFVGYCSRELDAIAQAAIEFAVAVWIQGSPDWEEPSHVPGNPHRPAHGRCTRPRKPHATACPSSSPRRPACSKLACGLREFAQARLEFEEWVAARAWMTGDGPRAIWGQTGSAGSTSTGPGARAALAAVLALAVAPHGFTVARFTVQVQARP